MTTNEARNKISACESDITSAYKELKSSASFIGANANQTASSATVKKTLWPLLLCVVGLFFFSSAWFLALCLIAFGIFLAYQLRKSAKETERRVENGYEALLRTLNYHETI